MYAAGTCDGYPNARNFIGILIKCACVQLRPILSVPQRIDCSIVQWDSNSQLILKDDPYVVNLEHGQINFANGVETLSRLL